MNRHERRRLKKTTQVNYTHNNELMKSPYEEQIMSVLK